MSVVFVLVFAAIIMASLFLFAFIWSVKNGQYEDTYTPSVRILFDDTEIKKEEEEEEEEVKASSPTLLRGRRESENTSSEHIDKKEDSNLQCQKSPV